MTAPFPALSGALDWVAPYSLSIEIVCAELGLRG
jgi:hypothetical protein